MKFIFRKIHKFVNEFMLYNRNSIKNREYFNESGFQHMKFYLSGIDDSLDLSIEHSPFDMDYIYETRKEIEGLLKPKYDEISWKNQYGPDTFEGGLKKFIVQEGITRIGKYAFAYNLNLSELYLPSTLEVIDSNAFFRCRKLQSIIIPSKVKKIGKDSFDYGLNHLYLYAEYPPKISKLGISNECKIYIPKQMLNRYINNLRWKKYNKQFIPI